VDGGRGLAANACILLAMPRRPPIPAVAAQQHGAFTRRQAHEAGWSNRLLASAVREGVLVKRHPEVFLLAGPRPIATEDHAALLAGGPHVVLSGWSAARRHSWSPPAEVPDPPCITVPVGHHLRLSDVVVLRWYLPAQHVRRLRDGTLVTAPARTLVDCLRLAPDARREHLLDAALLRRWTGLVELRAVVADLRGRPGVGVLTDLLVGVESGARSRAERLAQQVLRRTGLPGWQWNHPVPLPDGGLAVVDAALPHLRIAVEIDGRAFHSDVTSFQRDRTRQNALVAAGWTVLRFTWADLVHRPDLVVATVLAAVARAQAS
jgi:very-short-patch-repair endonuclease